MELEAGKLVAVILMKAGDSQAKIMAGQAKEQLTESRSQTVGSQPVGWRCAETVT